MIDYIQALEDNDTPASVNANLLFSSLEEQRGIETSIHEGNCSRHVNMKYSSTIF